MERCDTNLSLAVAASVDLHQRSARQADQNGRKRGQLLRNRRGGLADGGLPVASIILWDPGAGAIETFAATLSTARYGQSATILANGLIVLMSVGMSNTTQEFSTFIPVANADPVKNAQLRIIGQQPSRLG